MEQFIEYILQFGNLNKHQIELIKSKATKTELQKDDYYIEAGKIVNHTGFIIDGVLRVCYYNKNGEEITKIFLAENWVLFNFGNQPFPEYVQAATNCRLLIFSDKDWQDISNTIVGWESIMQKIKTKALTEKLAKVSPLVSQDATTRYQEFLEKYPGLANRIPLSYIASYLGITQQSLSRIRRNIS